MLPIVSHGEYADGTDRQTDECQTVRPFQFPTPMSGTLSRISSGTRPSLQTVSDVCLKRSCSLNTSAFSALDVLDDNLDDNLVP